jgi:polyisoprenoid-binding protein YceI
LNSKTKKAALRICVPALAVLAACAQPLPFEREISAAPLAEASFAELARTGAAIYRIQPAESLLLVHVGKDGKMASMGHEHAVVSRDMQGLVALADDPAASRAQVAMPLISLVVDEPEYRDRLALDTEISDADRAGTYSNMRKVLEAELYPWVQVEARFASVPSDPVELSVSITMHGAALEYVVPVQLEITDKRLTVHGHLQLRQSDFGMTPYSAVGGLLRVADELGVEF